MRPIYMHIYEHIGLIQNVSLTYKNGLKCKVEGY